jgi:energy-coupling factor transporter ATP-binding protein EcfA2
MHLLRPNPKRTPVRGEPLCPESSRYRVHLINVQSLCSVADRKSSLLGAMKKAVVTIIIVGETGAGKTAFMSLLANICLGADYDTLSLFHNRENESHLPKSQSQTSAAFMYQFKDSSGTQIRILDTPGLADTRGLEQDDAHKASIAKAIQTLVDTIDAVIVMANGTVEQLGVATDYALNTISAMFPRSIVDNIGFLFTNVDTILSFNFQMSTLPEEVRSAQIWTIQNPLALYMRYQENVGAHVPENQLVSLRHLMGSNYDRTVDTIQSLMQWVDARATQPTLLIQELYNMTTNIESAILSVFARMAQLEEKRVALLRLSTELCSSNQASY